MVKQHWCNIFKSALKRSPVKGLVMVAFCMMLLFNQMVFCQLITELPYNKTCFLTTHNSFNCSRNGFLLPNQKYGIQQQLNDGVRALMLDVYEVKGRLYVYHSIQMLGKEPFAEVLKEVEIFLEVNRNAVITLLLENYAPAYLIQSDLHKAGLSKFQYYADSIREWPTIQELIDDNTRLLVFNDVNDTMNRQARIFTMWDFFTETHFSVNRMCDFKCSTNRGKSDNPLFVLNHFINGGLGIGSRTQSKKANGMNVILHRCFDCKRLSDKYPNFIVVDFYHLGNPLKAVDSINLLKVQELKSR